MFDLLSQWFNDLDNGAMSAKEMCEEQEQLFDDNPQVGFVRRMRELGLHGEDQLLLVLFCYLLINNDDEDIRFCQMEDVFSSVGNFNTAKGELRSGTHVLQEKKLIEYVCEDGIACNNRFKLTEDTKRDLLAEMKINTTEEHLADVLRSADLAEKQLFYSKENQQQVDELCSFLMPEKYEQIHQRLAQTGFRQGFACLFYGGPGTGKTETVYQLARRTGRSLFLVDVPKIKSKWVGESEKNIKALFDRYREMVKRNKLAPILLFNEADAIIGIRKGSAESAVDKMENSIQNIILQEMEQLDGILIATTNLPGNLDKAFERRFLYKIHFERPDATVRSHILMQMIPSLEEDEALELAGSYDLSGGQIENVARKYAISNILHGEDPSCRLKVISSYCKDEAMGDKQRKAIGFC